MALKGEHLIPFIDLIVALRIDESLKMMSKKTDISDLSDEEMQNILNEKGIDFIFSLLKKAPQAKTQLYAFLAVYEGVTEEEILNGSLSSVIQSIKRLLKEPDLKDFLKLGAE